MKTLLLCATLVLALAPTAISAAKNCASIAKGQQCKNAGCKWDLQTGDKRKSCSGNVVEDETDTVEDAPDVVVGCWKFDKKRKCERKGCDWTKEGKRYKSCNDPAPRPSTIAPPGPTAAAAPKAPSEWDTKPGCCRAGGKQVDVLYKETYSAVTATDADAMCANQCVDNLNCTAYEMTKKKKAKKNKRSPSKFICELHDSAIDSVSRSTKSCRASTTSCNIHVSGGCPTASLPLNDTVFKDAIADCLAVDPVGGNCTDSPYGPMACWDVSDVTDYSRTFYFKTKFNGDITGWNTSAATTMEDMFEYAWAFNQPINEWVTESVTTMESMFYNAKAFNNSINDWKTGAVTTMESMLSLAVAFNQPINDLETGAVTTMKGMFAGAAAFNQPINDLKTGAVTTMESMFRNAAAFNQPINDLETGAVTTFKAMFAGTKHFNQDLKDWDTGAATTFEQMFSSAVAFDQDISGWNTGSATASSDMFYCGQACLTQPCPQSCANTCSIDAAHAITCP